MLNFRSLHVLKQTILCVWRDKRAKLFENLKNHLYKSQKPLQQILP